jgi:hypothetical protein
MLKEFEEKSKKIKKGWGTVRNQPFYQSVLPF